MNEAENKNERTVLAGASWEKQKYFFERKFDSLPQSVKDEIRNVCVIMAERLGCTFLIYFEENGDVGFEIIKNEGDFDFDDIGAELEIKSLRSEKKELLKSLKLWYVINLTEEGRKVREELLRQREE